MAAGLDYSEVTDFVTVFSTPFLNCTMILIESDSVVEGTEQFLVSLTSLDSAVVVALNSQLAPVVILDDSGTTLLHGYGVGIA